MTNGLSLNFEVINNKMRKTVLLSFAIAIVLFASVFAGFHSVLVAKSVTSEPLVLSSSDIVRSKTFPEFMAFGEPIGLVNLTHKFFLNGSVLVWNNFGDKLVIKVPQLPSGTLLVALYYNSSHVAHNCVIKVFRNVVANVWFYYDFVVKDNGVKITIVGTLAVAGQIKIPFYVLNHSRYDAIAKRLWSCKLNEFNEIVNGIGFDWSDASVTWSFNEATKTLNFNVGKNFNIDPSLVVTTTSVETIKYPLHRKTFFAQTRHWAFYLDSSNQLTYKSSTDGSTWNSATAVSQIKIEEGRKFTVHTDGTYVYLAVTNGTSTSYRGNLMYKRGQLSSDGTITWDATVNLASGTANDLRPDIVVDSDGYPWIIYQRYDNGAIRIKKSSTQSGSSSSDWNDNLLVSKTNYAMMKLLRRTNGKLYALYYQTMESLKGKAYDGTSWGSEESVTRHTLYNYLSWDCAMDVTNDEVHVCYLEATSYDIHHVKRTTSWQTPDTVQSATTLSSYPALSISESTLYCFWAGSPSSNHIYHKKYVSGTWDTNPTDWITETALTSNDKLTCYYQAYSSKIGLLYMNKMSSPYQIRYEYLSITGDTTKPTYSNVGTNTTNAGIVCRFYAQWSDNVGLSGFIFGCNNTGVWVNDTWTDLWTGTPTSGWSNVTKTLNSTIGVVIKWRIWANDTSNNWNNTGMQSFTTTWYGEITIVTTTHSWDITPGQNDVPINEGTINITVTSNGAYNIQVKGSANLAYANQYIGLGNVTVHKDTLDSSVPLTTSYQNVPGLTNQPAGTNVPLTFKLWLDCPLGVRDFTYQYTLYIQITQYTG